MGIKKLISNLIIIIDNYVSKLLNLIHKIIKFNLFLILIVLTLISFNNQIRNY